jgi:hypothetical protein
VYLIVTVTTDDYHVLDQFLAEPFIGQVVNVQRFLGRTSIWASFAAIVP